MIKLNSAQDAIKQAIEGGYLTSGTEVDVHPDGDIYISLDGGDFQYAGTTVNIFTDPLFWIALGKARGWNDDYHSVRSKETNQLKNEIWDWKYYASKWFDTRLSGGDEKKFWESLPQGTAPSEQPNKIPSP